MVASVLTAVAIRRIQGHSIPELMMWAGTFTAVVGVVFYLGGLYSFQTRLTIRQLSIRIWRSFAISTLTLWAIYYALPNLFMGRGVFALSLMLSLVAVSCWRVVLMWLLTRHHFMERILILGADEDARVLARELLQREHLGYRVVGFLDNDLDLQGVSIVNPRVLGTTSQVESIAKDRNVTRIVVARRNVRGWLDLDALLSCKTSGIPVERGEDLYERLTGKLSVDSQRKSWLVFSDGFVVSPSVLLAKRMIDAVAACLGLLIASPVMMLTAIAIKLDSPGPVLFSQDRVGKDGAVFKIWKFRSMIVGARPFGWPQ